MHHLIQFCCAILDPLSNRDKIAWQIIKSGYLKKAKHGYCYKVNNGTVKSKTAS